MKHQKYIILAIIFLIAIAIGFVFYVELGVPIHISFYYLTVGILGGSSLTLVQVSSNLKVTVKRLFEEKPI